MTELSGLYFYSQGEANEWLDFEACVEEREVRAYAENDRFHEWQNWRANWIAGMSSYLVGTAKNKETP